MRVDVAAVLLDGVGDVGIVVSELLWRAVDHRDVDEGGLCAAGILHLLGSGWRLALGGGRDFVLGFEGWGWG